MTVIRRTRPGPRRAATSGFTQAVGREIESIKDQDPERCREVLDLIGGLYAHEEKIRRKKLSWIGEARLAQGALGADRRSLLAMVQDHRRGPVATAEGSASVGRELCAQPARRAGSLAVESRCPDRYESPGGGIRAIPMGRRNRLFCWSELGAEHVGIIQSLVSTCRMHEVDLYIWLVDVLQRIATHPARDVAQLTPRL